MIRVLGTELNQWDVGRYISVTNSEADHIHLANKGDSRAVIMEIADAQVKIPDYLLQTGKQVCAYAVKDGVTVERYTFFVHHRERPENYIYEEDQRNFIYAWIEVVEETVARAEKAAEAIESGKIEKTMYTRDVFVGGAKDVYGSWGPRNPFIVDHTPLLSSIKNEMYISTMKIPKAGQHFLILPEGSNYLYKMQITESAQTRVFDVNEMQAIAAGTYPDNYYYEAENGIRVIFSAKTRVDISQKTFEDGFTGQKRLNFQKNTVFEDDNTDFPFPSVEFYVNGPAEVTIWWVAGESNRIFAIQSKNRSGPSRMEVSGTFVAHGSAETKGTHTAGHLNVKSEAKIGGTLTVDNDIKMAGSLDVGNDMKLAGGLKFTGSDSLDMGGNDIKNVQSMRMAGTLAVENDSKLRSIKPYKRVDETGVEQEVYNIGTDDAFYDRGCFKRLRLGKPVTDENGKIVSHEYTELSKDKLDTVLSEVNQLKCGKLDNPATVPEVGKILKVTAVNEDGTFSCEWADAPGAFGSETWQTLAEFYNTEEVSEIVFGSDENPLNIRNFVLAFSGEATVGNSNPLLGYCGYYSGLMSVDNSAISLTFYLSDGTNRKITTASIRNTRNLYFTVNLDLGICIYQSGFFGAQANLPGTISYFSNATISKIVVNTVADGCVFTAQTSTNKIYLFAHGG